MIDKKKKGLGRGLSSLFGDVKDDELISEHKSDKKVALIGDLTRNKYQPRTSFDEGKIKELAESIKQNGLIQPIAVRSNSNDSSRYEIVAGERRWIAAQKAGLHEVPIVVLDLDDSQALEVAILENIQREDLNAVEEAKAYDRLRTEFGYDQDSTAKLMSKSRSHVSNTLRLLTLPEDIISMIEEGLITAGQARPLIGLSDPSSIAEEIVKKKMSARSVEKLIRDKKKPDANKTDPNILDMQNKLEQSLGLKVNILNKKNNSGKISIEYKDIEQFELITKLLK
jgi:ParB family chromosome partitioning protein|tara:strand:- start:405 stop:1253 length:849 start_codon:yes stop_codon:yes gene_type:complete